MVLNKGRKRTPTITYTLISTYRISGFIINNRDLIQIGVFFESISNPEY
jgi:uncharacterized protein Veg